MYRLTDSLLKVHGVGPKLFEQLQDAKFSTVKDLLLHLPFRYEDRSERFTIDQVKQLADSPEKKLFTLEAIVKSSRNNFFRGRSMQSATLVDETGQITASWFNNPYVVKRLKNGESYLFSGQVGISKKGQIFLTQPIVEDINKESIHTNRLVPIYSNIPGLLPTVLRKVQKDLIDNIEEIPDKLGSLDLVSSQSDISPLSLTKALKIVHFPDEIDSVIEARERFALEELVLLIQHSLYLKEEWKKNKKTIQTQNKKLNIPSTIPFQLTTSQQRSAQEVIDDLTQDSPMNRLLIGDVGSGKTIVAGLAMQKIVESGHHAAIIAPTQILAEQHTKTLQKFFPEIPNYLITSKSKVKIEKPGFIIGTHAILNLIKKLKEERTGPSIALIIFDEQHRFGVTQRSELVHHDIHPHILTMTATPIPRSLMLTIFSHLNLSTIDELPKNRVPTKTWVLPETKRGSMYQWLKDQIKKGKKEGVQFQALIVCPFINPSESEALENVAAAKEMFESVSKELKTEIKKSAITVSLLHSKIKKAEKQQVITDLFSGKIDVLVTTPIIEVGVDLPQASAIVIEASERFGLASLHQLRGRVGRAGQQGYCLLFSNSKSGDAHKRLKKFETIHSGQELAELDLENRGAGDLFGTQQHGFDNLQFASWTDLELIRKAKSIIEQLNKNKAKYQSPLLKVSIETKVLAN
ncbi:MAG: ATP-dependent DNA helicase RecG [Patescibacteria group bacterium]